MTPIMFPSDRDIPAETVEIFARGCAALTHGMGRVPTDAELRMLFEAAQNFLIQRDLQASLEVAVKGEGPDPEKWVRIDPERIH